MNISRGWTPVIVFPALMIFLLSACAFQQTRTALRPSDMERILTRSGFVRNPADTPEKMADIKSLPQRKVFPQRAAFVQAGGDEVYYVYADSKYCRCLYVGDAAAFGRFESLIDEENYSRGQCVDDRLRQRSEEAWKAWGPLSDLCSDRPR